MTTFNVQQQQEMNFLRSICNSLTAQLSQKKANTLEMREIIKGFKEMLMSFHNTYDFGLWTKIVKQ